MRSVLLIIGATLVLFGCDPENGSDFDTHIAPEAMLVDVAKRRDVLADHAIQVAAALAGHADDADVELLVRGPRFLRRVFRSGGAL